MHIRTIQRRYWYCTIIISLFFVIALDARKALIVAPVADLVADPIAVPGAAFCSYNDIPLAAANPRQARVCPRLHQAIFNELIDIIEEQKDEARVAISSAYYTIPNNPEKQVYYWTHKKNLIPLDTLEKHGLDLKKIPCPIDFNNPALAQTHTNSITLLFPWSDPVTKQTFSSGTRFVLTPQQQQKNAYSIYIFDPNKVSFKETGIPKKICARYANLKNSQERVACFVQLLRTWAHQQNGFIPYVWGGCSFINVYNFIISICCNYTVRNSFCY